MELALRRARRGDFDAICQVAADCGAPAPPRERSVLKRFRNLVADLGADLYVATKRERPVGFVHVAYDRDLLLGQRATILALLGDSPETVGSLLALASKRAAGRGCRDLRILPDPWVPDLATVAGIAGWNAADRGFQFDLTQGSGQS